MSYSDLRQEVARIKLEDPMLTRVAKAVCLQQHIWPDYLLVPVTNRDPTLRSLESLARAPYVVYGRRLAWKLAWDLTDFDVETIGRVFGRRSGNTVRRLLCNWDKFDQDENGLANRSLRQLKGKIVRKRALKGVKA